MLWLMEINPGRFEGDSLAPSVMEGVHAFGSWDSEMVERGGERAGDRAGLRRCPIARLNGPVLRIC